MSSVIHKHYCVFGSKRLRTSEQANVTRPGPGPHSRRLKKTVTTEGELSFSTVRKLRGQRNSKQLNVNPPPLPSNSSAFPIHSPPSTPYRYGLSQSGNSAVNTPSRHSTVQFLLDDPIVELPNVGFLLLC
jgi:hypothetical protein